MDDTIGPENVQQEIRSCQAPDRLMIGRAICASLLLHLLFFLILAGTATRFTFYPAVGAFEHFDFIWVTPSPEPAAPAVTTEGPPPENSGSQEQTAGAVKSPPLEMAEPMAAPTPQHPGPGKKPSAAQRPLEVVTVVPLETLKTTAPLGKRAGELKKGAPAGTKKEARDKPQHTAELTEEQLRLGEKAAERAESNAIPGDTVGKNNHSELEQDAVALRMEVEIAAQQHNHGKPAGGKREPEVIVVQQGRPVGEQEKRSEPVVFVTTVPEKAAAERNAEQARPAREPEAGKSQSGRQAAQQKVERAEAGQGLVSARALEGKRKTASAGPKKTEPGSQAAVPKAPGRERSVLGPEVPGSRLLPGQKPQAPLPGSRVAKGGDLPALAVPKSEPAEAPKPSERMSGNKGLVIASLRGDLKLVMTGDNAINLSVTFREYPKNRRNKVSRSEARKVHTLAPILTRTREDTREAVIETAKEGVYTFSAESKQEKGSRATFTLKLFESGSGERIAKLGARTVSGKAVLVKVLMPEAVIWDDEAAFSGTLEDSDSETRFNTGTGLFWKEFHD